MAAGPAFDKEAVYWLADPAGRFLPEIAGDVEFRPQSSELCFYDTQRPHALPAKFTGGDAASGWRFDAPGGRKIVVRRLDRATFEKVFRRSISDAPKFKTDAELQKFYRELIRQA